MSSSIVITTTSPQLQFDACNLAPDAVNNIKLKHVYEHKPSRKYKSIIGTFESELKWFNIIFLTTLHVLGVWTFIFFPYTQHWRIFFWGVIQGHLAGFGVTGGVHRLWTHRSYKANLPLRIFLMLCFALAGQNSIFDWVRDHRVHHKYTETEADPHNAKRGFFFAHVGWLMMKKHPEVIRRGREVDMSDVLADPVVQFQERHFFKLKLLVCYIIPTIIPPLCWNEDWFWAFMTSCTARHIFTLNSTWSVNSFAHIWGNKPYDKNIQPAENIGVSWVALGEGWHNYHHTFPWDYKAAELGDRVNMTAQWINFFAKIGWAYDLKTTSNELVKAVVKNRGDGTHVLN